MVGQQEVRGRDGYGAGGDVVDGPGRCADVRGTDRALPGTAAVHLSAEREPSAPPEVEGACSELFVGPLLAVHPDRDSIPSEHHIDGGPVARPECTVHDDRRFSLDVGSGPA
jgi:hypothetical protein